MKLFFFFFILLLSSLSFADDYPRQPRYTHQTCTALPLDTIVGCVIDFYNASANGQTYEHTFSHWNATQPPPFPDNSEAFFLKRQHRITGEYTSNLTVNTSIAWLCPYGGTASNSMCVNAPPCPEGESRDSTGQCVAPPCEAGRVLDSLSVSNFNSVEPTNLRCISGCYAPVKVSLQSQICYPAGTNYPAGCVIPAYFEWIDNGHECEGGSDPWASTSPDPLPPQPTEPPNCPECDCIKSGQGYGTVNGAVVCVGLGSEGSKPVEFKGAPTVTTTTPAPTPENPNPEPVTTVTSSTSSTTVGASTGSGSSGAGTDNPQVTTTTTDENGNTIETTQDKESFCSSNPTHALCQPKTDCDKYPDSIACQIMGDAPELGEGDGIPTIEREIGLIVKPSLPEASGCPAPINISIGGHSITVSFQPFCDYAEAFRPLVIASAWLSAALIVVGFRGNE